MMVVRKGFFLIEFLIYLCIFSCISLFLMHFVVHTTIYLKTHNSALHHSFTLLTALDLAVYELENATAEKKQWYKTDKDCAIWHSSHHKKDICLAIIDKKLVRIVGEYIPLQNKWKSKKTNLLTDSIKEFSLEYTWENEPEEHLSLIQCSITGSLSEKNEYTVFKSVRLHNRYLV